ncbi:MAG TPA: hypothetical protein VIV60_05480 [Polyangiaceae bacterium]
MEVLHRQQEVALLSKPGMRAVCAALTAGAIAARMEPFMLGATVFATGDVSTHLEGAAPCNIAQSTSMTG